MTVAHKNTRHGHARRSGDSRTYKSWCGIIQRCTNQRNAKYSRYGGRGIGVCDRWMSFDNFLADMGDAPAGCSIDRINNDGNYEPVNCRWATVIQQQRNTSHTARVELNGEMVSLADLAERSGVPYKTLFNRIRKLGWSAHRAFITPVFASKRNKRAGRGHLVQS